MTNGQEEHIQCHTLDKRMDSVHTLGCASQAGLSRMLPDFITLLRTTIFNTENLSPSEVKTSHREMGPDLRKELITPHLPSTGLPRRLHCSKYSQQEAWFAEPKARDVSTSGCGDPRGRVGSIRTPKTGLVPAGQQRETPQPLSNHPTLSSWVLPTPPMTWLFFFSFFHLINCITRLLPHFSPCCRDYYLNTS